METRNAQGRVPVAMPEKFKWLTALLADTELSSGAKNVATRLMLHHNDRTGQCNPSHQRLAAGLGLSEKYGRKTVCRLVGELKTRGWIETTDTAGASQYRFVIDRAAVAMIPADEPDAPEQGQGVPLISGRGVPLTSGRGATDEWQGVPLASGTEPSREPVREPSISPAPSARAAGSGRNEDEAFGRKREPKPERARWTDLPEDWQPDAACRTLALEAGVRASDLDGVVTAFVLHQRGNGARSPDWPAKWQGWCRRHVEIRTAREARQPAARPPSERKFNGRIHIPLAPRPATSKIA